jgi:hypothetical protein
MFTSEKLVWTARLTTLLTPVAAVAYGLSLALVATIWRGSVPVGSFQGGSIILFPLFLAAAGLGWKWPLFGGLAVLAAGELVISAMLSASGWPGWYKVPYLTLWAFFMAGGALYIENWVLEKRTSR